MNCDLCNTSIGSSSRYYRVPPGPFMDAARAGLRPRGAAVSVLSAGELLGIHSPDELYELWLAKVIQDSTDWILCGECVHDYRQHGGTIAVWVGPIQRAFDRLENDENVKRVKREQVSFYKLLGVLEPMLILGWIPAYILACGLVGERWWHGPGILFLGTLLFVPSLVGWNLAIRRIKYSILRRRGRAIAARNKPTPPSVSTTDVPAREPSLQGPSLAQPSVDKSVPNATSGANQVDSSAPSKQGVAASWYHPVAPGETLMSKWRRIAEALRALLRDNRAYLMTVWPPVCPSTSARGWPRRDLGEGAIVQSRHSFLPIAD